MNIKEVAEAMQDIEFILFTTKNGDVGKLHAGEAEAALKRKMNYKLQKFYPESKLQKNYFNISIEQFHEEFENWNANHI